VWKYLDFVEGAVFSSKPSETQQTFTKCQRLKTGSTSAMKYHEYLKSAAFAFIPLSV
jgi:hypothetical protein